MDVLPILKLGEKYALTIMGIAVIILSTRLSRAGFYRTSTIFIGIGGVFAFLWKFIFLAYGESVPTKILSEMFEATFAIFTALGVLSHVSDLTIAYTKELEGEIAERKRVVEALRESEEKFKTLAEESPNMIFINERGRVVYANKKCEEMMGYKREEFYAPDFDFMVLIAPESRDLVKENFRKHMSGEEIPPYEYKLLTKDGREIIGLHTTKLIDFEGESAILGIITDVTKQKRAKENLNKKIEELEKWQRLTAGRETRMIELKKEIKELKERLQK